MTPALLDSLFTRLLFVLAFVNHKGGVYKTESTLRIGMQLALRQLRPTLFDLDPQANLSKRLNCTFPKTHIGMVLGGAIPSMLELLRAIHFVGDGSRLVPSPGLELENIAAGLHSRSWGRITALHDAIEQSKAHLSGPILIDTPPNLGMLTLNAMRAATHLVICAAPEEDAIDGIRSIQRTVAMLKAEHRDAPVRILGSIATGVQEKTNTHQQGLIEMTSDGMPPLLGMVRKSLGENADQRRNEDYERITNVLLAALEGNDARPTA